MPQIDPQGFVLIQKKKICRVVPGGIEFLVRGRRNEKGIVVLNLKELEELLEAAKGLNVSLLQSECNSANMTPKGDP